MGIKHEYTIEEVQDMNCHAELINGELVIENKTTPEHNEVITELVFAFKRYIKEHNDSCRCFSANVGLYIDEIIKGNISEASTGDKNYCLPDFMVVCEPGAIDERGIHQAPLFLAEVTSDATKVNDYNAKLEAYKKIGVQEYWIIDLQRKLIMKYLASENYIPKTFMYPESMKVSMFDGLMIDVSNVMGLL